MRKHSDDCIHDRPDLGRECPLCRQEWLNVKAREAAMKRNPKGNYTCKDCPHAELCQVAWDDYNQDGDCLAEK